jgi:2-dehydropantoate 2-reductase
VAGGSRLTTKPLVGADTVLQDMTSSLHYDLEAGRLLDVEWLAGAVVKLGCKRGVAAALCHAVWDILALSTPGRGGH